MVVAVIGLAGRAESDAPSWGRWLAISALLIMTVGLVAAIVDRAIEREVVAMVFVLLNVAAHVAIVVDATALPATRGTVIAFCLLMMIGDAVKIVFLRRERFAVRAVGTSTLVGLTSTFIALAALAILGALTA